VLLVTFRRFIEPERNHKRYTRLSDELDNTEIELRNQWTEADLSI